MQQTETELTPSDVGSVSMPLVTFDKLRKQLASSGSGEMVSMYPLSPMQEGMLFQALMEPQSSAYFEQMSFVIQGSLHEAYLEKSLSLLMKRYDIFRTVFMYEELERPLQIVLKKRNPSIVFEDFTGLTEDEIQISVERFKQLDREQGFDLTKDVLLRIAVLRTGERRYEIVWSHHHILMDGWCMGIVLKEFFDMYAQLCSGKSIDLPAVKPYIYFIEWLKEQDREEALGYCCVEVVLSSNINGLPKYSLVIPAVSVSMLSVSGTSVMRYPIRGMASNSYPKLRNLLICFQTAARLMDNLRLISSPDRN